jgi:hypothetical protein
VKDDALSVIKTMKSNDYRLSRQYGKNETLSVYQDNETKVYLIIKAKPNITDYQSDVEKNTLSAIKTMKSNTTDYQGSETRMRHYLLSRQ